MTSKIKVTTIYHCSLERAFKTPMLCDISKVHTGYGIMPKVTHCANDENWGKPGYSKTVFVAESLTQKGGWASVDKVIERVDNSYWNLTGASVRAAASGVAHSCLLHKTGLRHNYKFPQLSRIDFGHIAYIQAL